MPSSPFRFRAGFQGKEWQQEHKTRFGHGHGDQAIGCRRGGERAQGMGGNPRPVFAEPLGICSQGRLVPACLISPGLGLRVRGCRQGRQSQDSWFEGVDEGGGSGGPKGYQSANLFFEQAALGCRSVAESRAQEGFYLAPGSGLSFNRFCEGFSQELVQSALLLRISRLARGGILFLDGGSPGVCWEQESAPKDHGEQYQGSKRCGHHPQGSELWSRELPKI